MAKVYKMWGLFNYERPPIFVQNTRRECVIKGIKWLGGESYFNKHRREGSITIEKIIVTRPSSTTRGSK